MGKRISELPVVTALGDSDVLIANHIDTSEQEPTTATSKITVANLKQTLGINGKVDTSDIGAANGVAELDGNGKIPSAQLPGYVDDVIEGYYDAVTDRFYTESTFEHVITPASDISWVDIAANKSYRWTGSVYVRVDEGVQLGETSGSAYRGDRGKTAYDFSQNPATATPSMDGTGVAGSSGKWAREDHVHPKDTTKADKVASATNGNLAGLDSDGNLTDSGNKPSDFLTSHQDISGKADKVSGATNGNVATLDASGNLVDSGKILGVSVPSNAVFTDMAGADASYNGSHGYVPAPSAGDQDKVLSGAGVWVPQSSGAEGAKMLYGATQLSSSANLNTYVFPTYKGEYYYEIAGHSISNMPTGLTGQPFRLIVESLGGSAGSLSTGGSLPIGYNQCTLQTLIVTNLNNTCEVKTYRRRGYNSGTQSATWSDWVSYEDEIAKLNSQLVDVTVGQVTAHNLTNVTFRFNKLVKIGKIVMIFVNATFDATTFATSSESLSVNKGYFTVPASFTPLTESLCQDQLYPNQVYTPLAGVYAIGDTTYEFSNACGINANNMIVQNYSGGVTNMKSIKIKDFYLCG